MLKKRETEMERELSTTKEQLELLLSLQGEEGSCSDSCCTTRPNFFFLHFNSARVIVQLRVDRCCYEECVVFMFFTGCRLYTVSSTFRKSSA